MDFIKIGNKSVNPKHISLIEINPNRSFYVYVIGYSDRIHVLEFSTGYTFIYNLYNNS